MTLKELVETQSIFSAVNARQSFEFIDNPDDLDFMLKSLYGERNVFSPYISASVEDLAMVIVNENSEAWDAYVKMAVLTDNVDSRREVTETTNETEDRTSTKNDVNKVAAFNASELIDNDGSDSNSTDGMVGDTTRTLTESNINVSNSFKLLNDLTKRSIITKVLKDVSNTITLPLY